MNKILLLSPPYDHVYREINIRKINFNLPSLGIAGIASFLKSKGKEIELIDVPFYKGGWLGILEKIRHETPHIIGITATTPQISAVIQMTKDIKKVSNKSTVVVGGHHASALPKETLDYEGIDLVVIGEGEYTMLELARDLDLETIKGICYEDASGVKHINPPRPLIDDLNILPPPLYEALPLHSYGYLGLGSAVSVISGRGCPFDCSYCASDLINKRRYRTKNVKNFVDEVEMLYRDFNMNAFSFCDEVFTINEKRTLQICQEISRRDLPIRWSCLSRVDTLSYEVLRAMKEAGCQMIEIGVESGDIGILKKINKRINLEQVDNVVSWANKLKLEINVFFILGLPYETVETMRRTIKYSKKLRVDYAQFSLFVPLPGTPFWDIAKEGSVIECIAKDWSDYSRYGSPIVSSPDIPPHVLQKYHKRAIIEFYFRPYMIWRTLKKINSISKLRQYFQMGVAFLILIAKK